MTTGFFGRLWPHLSADRRRPPLAALAAESDPERFVWRILPHAARTFGLAIVLLPARLARPVAAAYLWCRTLDTLEDLSPDATTRAEGFAACVAAAAGGGAPPLPIGAIVQDVRDRAHLLLVERASLLGQFTATLGLDSRARIAALVQAMADGMEDAARRRERSGGVLAAGPAREAYCRAVLAEPLAFAEAELRAQGNDLALTAERRRLTALTGELIQLANVCRDVEKDLARGVAYDEALAPFLAAGAAPAAVVEGVRARLLLRVVELGDAVEPYFVGLPLDRRPGARAAAAVMCAATAMFFQAANRRLERPVLDALAPISDYGVTRAAIRAATSTHGARIVFARLRRAFGPAAV